MRESDTVGRLGGDEFAVLLRGADTEHATHVAEELVSAIKERDESMIGDRSATAVSAGVASIRPTHATADDALAAADRAMYEAKRKGGGRVETHAS